MRIFFLALTLFTSFAVAGGNSVLDQATHQLIVDANKSKEGLKRLFPEAGPPLTPDYKGEIAKDLYPKARAKIDDLDTKLTQLDQMLNSRVKMLISGGMLESMPQAERLILKRIIGDIRQLRHARFYLDSALRFAYGRMQGVWMSEPAGGSRDMTLTSRIKNYEVRTNTEAKYPLNSAFRPPQALELSSLGEKVSSRGFVEVQKMDQGLLRFLQSQFNRRPNIKWMPNADNDPYSERPAAVAQ